MNNKKKMYQTKIQIFLCIKNLAHYHYKYGMGCLNYNSIKVYVCVKLPCSTSFVNAKPTILLLLLLQARVVQQQSQSFHRQYNTYMGKGALISNSSFVY